MIFHYLRHVRKSHVARLSGDFNKEGGFKRWFVKAREGLPSWQRLKLGRSQDTVDKREKSAIYQLNFDSLCHCFVSNWLWVEPHFGSQHIIQLWGSALSIPLVSVFISVWAVVETIIGVWEVGRIVQGQNTVLAYFQLLRELNGYLLSGFVLQHSHIAGLPIIQLEAGNQWVNFFVPAQIQSIQILQ